MFLGKHKLGGILYIYTQVKVILIYAKYVKNFGFETLLLDIGLTQAYIHF